jgi:hypothetical protein
MAAANAFERSCAVGALDGGGGMWRLANAAITMLVSSDGVSCGGTDVPDAGVTGVSGPRTGAAAVRRAEPDAPLDAAHRLHVLLARLLGVHVDPERQRELDAERRRRLHERRIVAAAPPSESGLSTSGKNDSASFCCASAIHTVDGGSMCRGAARSPC